MTELSYFARETTGPKTNTFVLVPGMRVLIVEDEKKIAVLLQKAFQTHGFSVELAHDGRTAFDCLKTSTFDVVVLDIMLPDRDGLSILKEIRAKGLTTPVLALSARGQVGQRVHGLDAGADDYLAKPFVLAEVLARVRALARRTDQSRGLLQAGDLIVDPLKRTVTRAGAPIELTIREYRLLEFLMRANGQVCSRSAILEQVWEYDFDPGTNLVEVYIMRVREKIDGDFERKLLHTLRGIGYALREEP